MCGPSHSVLRQQQKQQSSSARSKKKVTLQRHTTLPGPLRSLPISTSQVKKNTLQHSKKNPYVGWFRHAPPRQQHRRVCLLLTPSQTKKKCRVVLTDVRRHMWLQQGLLRGGTTIWSDITKVPPPHDAVLSDAEETDADTATWNNDDYSYLLEDDDASIRSETRLDLYVDSPERLDYDISQMDILRMNKVASRHLDVESIANLPIVTYQGPGTQTGEGKKQSENKAFSWMLVHSDSEASDDEATTSEELPVCVICCEPFVVGDRLRVLPCSHSFHTGCIDRWLSGSSSNLDCFTAGCPTCKKRIPTQSYFRVGDALASHSFVA